MNPVLLMLAAHLAVMSSQFGSNVQVGDDIWTSFKVEHEKKYDSVAEEALRRQVFAYNLHQAEKFNSENPEATFKLGVNRLFDLSADEFQVLNGYRHSEDIVNRSRVLTDEELDSLIGSTSDEVPDSVDWRLVDGVVSGIKDQGACGSCWAFASTGVLEGQERTKRAQHLSSIPTNGKPVTLSEQELLDCDKVDTGCDGGIMANAFKSIHRLGGIESEKDYPYKAVESACLFNKKKVIMSDKSYRILNTGNEEQLKKTVAKYGPVSIAIHSTQMFQLYSSGVFNDITCSNDLTALNHAVLVVGYGTTKKGVDYWIVKNSWGTGWGDAGYIRMSRNRNNQCGIANIPTIATF